VCYAVGAHVFRIRERERERERERREREMRESERERERESERERERESERERERERESLIDAGIYPASQMSAKAALIRLRSLPYPNDFLCRSLTSADPRAALTLR